MANKRIQKKQQKRQLQQYVEAVQVARGVPQKQARKTVQNASLKSLNSIAQQEDKRQKQALKEQKAKRRKIDAQNRRRRKRQAIEKLGLNPFDFTLKQIDSIKIKDIENNQVTLENYPWLYGVHDFDFDKIYKLKDGKRFFFAFRDFSGETSLESIIKMYKNLSPYKLLDRLKQLVNLRPNYSKGGKRSGGSGSSGSAGDYLFLSGEQGDIEAMTRDVRKKNKRKSKRKEHGAQTYKGFQILKTGVRNSFDEVTPRQMIVIMCAIMSNVTEWDRVYFYKNIYKQIQIHMEDFANILPQPLDL